MAEKHMFQILSHQGNENQNSSEIPTYTCQWLTSITSVTAHVGE